MLTRHLFPLATESCSRRVITSGWVVGCAVTSLTIAGVSPARASTWIDATTGGLWSVNGNWSGGVGANGTGVVADFSTLNITADDIIEAKRRVAECRQSIGAPPLLTDEINATNETNKTG